MFLQADSGGIATTWIQKCLLNPLSEDVRVETALLLTFLMKTEDNGAQEFLDIILKILNDDKIHQDHELNASEFFNFLLGLMESKSLR